MNEQDIRQKTKETTASFHKELVFSKDDPLGDDGMHVLAGDPCLAAVLSLDLSDNNISDAGLLALLRSNFRPFLLRIILRGNRLTSAGVEALASSPLLAYVRTLDLRSNDIDNAGAIALATSPWTLRLERLSLDNNDIADEGAFALASSLFLRSVQSLGLSFNRLTDAGVRHLALAPSLVRSRLELDYNLEGAEGRATCRLRSALLSLSAFDLRYCVAVPLDFHALRVARLMALDSGDDDDLFGLKPHLLPEHRAWWEDKLVGVSDASLDRALALCPNHPRLLERKALLLRLQQTREEQLFF